MRLAFVAVGLLLVAALARAVAPGALAFAPVAHSALVTLTAAGDPQGVQLRLERTGGGAPLSVGELSATIDGRSVPVSARGADTWSAPWPEGLAGGSHRLEITLTHDGIREVLGGALPSPEAGGSAGAPSSAGHGLLRDHKQLAWWILNIGVVLIAAIAISRRTS